jgi:hypothetical protein
MHKILRSSLFTLFILSMSLIGRAQPSADSDKVDMADGLRANGKIYVVVIVVMTILAGLILYLIRLDRKIGRMEKGK